MSWTYLVPEVLRETRHLFSSPSHCPWGAIGLLVVVACGCGCCLGALCTLVAVSNQCRRVCLVVVKVVLANFSTVDVPADVRGRLAQYHRG